MKLIPLTKGYHAMIDDDDYDRVMQYSWQALVQPHGNTVYAYGRNENYKMQFLHRFVMNTPDDITVDHKDKNGLNCQKYNLRFATQSQQLANRVIFNPSGYRGVYPTGSLNKPWFTQLRHNGKAYYGGRYKTKEEAAKAYDDLAKQYHGEFATVNFP